jgi:hypothetical protein
VPFEFSPGDYFSYITAGIWIVLGLGVVMCFK